MYMGVKPTETELQRVDVTVKGNEWVVATKRDGKVTETKYKLELDQTKSPKQYKKIRIEGPDKGKTESGIYEIRGDTLRMCFLKNGGLPKDFSLKEGVDVKNKFIHEFKRVKLTGGQLLAQGPSEDLTKLKARIEKLEADNAALKKELAELQAKLAALKNKLSKGPSVAKPSAPEAAVQEFLYLFSGSSSG
jgi:uncharacterized protein (TIGR03067 family)